MHLSFNIKVLPFFSYIGPEFSKVLQKPGVEYRQANLTVECMFFVLSHISASTAD